MATLLQITGAHKSCGDQVLLGGADATLTDAARVGLVGRPPGWTGSGGR